MKQVYHSIEELLSNCANSALKSGISFVLGNNKHIKWSFASAFEDNGFLRAEFLSGDESPLFALLCAIDDGGFHGHISALAQTVTSVKLNTQKEVKALAAPFYSTVPS